MPNFVSMTPGSTPGAPAPAPAPAPAAPTLASVAPVRPVAEPVPAIPARDLITTSSALWFALIDELADRLAAASSLNLDRLAAMARQWTSAALIDLAPALAASPIRLMGGWPGLWYVHPLLHAALGDDVRRVFDADASRVLAKRTGAAIARRIRSVDIARGDALPFSPPLGAAMLAAWDMATYGGEPAAGRALLVRAMARDGAPGPEVGSRLALLVNAQLAEDTSVLWSIYNPEPYPVDAEVVMAGARAPLDVAGYRTLMESHMRDAVARQSDPECRAQLPVVRSTLWKVWAAPDIALADAAYTLDDLVNLNGPAPPILVQQARYMFGLARSMGLDGIAPQGVLSVLKGAGA